MRSYEEIKENKQFKILNYKTQGEDYRIDGYFFDPVIQKRFFVICTSSLGWEHVSVSTNNKTPSWDTMCRIKDLFWNEDECCIEYHPKKEDYINMHEHCLHIWKPIGIEIPTPPSIMVGLKGVSAEQSKTISKAFINSLSKEELKQQADMRGIKIGNRQMKRRAGIK